MATWEEILAANYNPVTSMRETHQAKMNQRQAENIARMQAANPGYLPGGMGNQPTNQFQQFAPPSLMDGQSDWLATQRQMAGEHFGNTGVPQSPSGGGGAFSGGSPSFGGGEGGVNEGGSAGQTAGGAYSGVGPAQFGDLPGAQISPFAATMFGPLALPFMGLAEEETKLFNQQTEQEGFLLDEMNQQPYGTASSMSNAAHDDRIRDMINALPESQVAHLPGVGLGGGGVSDNSGFGGGGGRGVTGGNQGAMGNTGPGDDGTGGRSSGGGGGGSGSGGPGSGSRGGRD